MALYPPRRKVPAALGGGARTCEGQQRSFVMSDVETVVAVAAIGAVAAIRTAIAVENVSGGRRGWWEPAFGIMLMV